MQRVNVLFNTQVVKCVHSKCYPSVSSPGILHGAGLSQLPKQRYLPSDLQTQNAPNSHLKYVW